MKKFISHVLLFAFAASCSGRGFQSSNTNAINSKQDISNDSPACLVKNSEYELELILNSYEITSTSGLSFGFNIMNHFLKAIGLNFKTKSGQVTMAMNLYDPLENSNAIASGKGTGESSGKEFAATINGSFLNGAGNYYYQTPFALLTERGIRSAFEETLKSLSDVETTWSTRISIINNENLVVIPVGTMAGLRIGDLLNIYEIKPEWTGIPCQSIYLPIKQSETPFALGTIVQIFKNSAVLKLSQKASERPLTIGMLVEANKLIFSQQSKAERKLYRSVSLREIKSVNLPIEGGGHVDLGLHARNQMQSLLRQYGFYQKEQ